MLIWSQILKFLSMHNYNRSEIVNFQKWLHIRMLMGIQSSMFLSMIFFFWIVVSYFSKHLNSCGFV